MQFTIGLLMVFKSIASRDLVKHSFAAHSRILRVRKRIGLSALYWGFLTTFATAAQFVQAANQGIGPRSIIIGQSAAFSGPSAQLGREFRRGAHYAFNEVNAHGGVHGRQIITLYRDDGYEPNNARNNTSLFLKRDKVFALFGYVGTATVLASLPLIQSESAPLIAPVTGAQAIRMPLQRLVFNLRASYHQEIALLVDYFVRFGRKAIAVVYQNDAFGLDGLRGVKTSLQQRGLMLVAAEPVERNSSDTLEAARRIARAKPEAVLLISSYGTNASFIECFRRLGGSAQIANLSFVGSNALANALPPPLRHGIAISQVVPFPWNPRYRIVREYQRAMQISDSEGGYSFSSLEGYMAAQLLIRALEKAGPALTRESLITALESLRQTDLGDYQINISPSSHSDSSFVQLTFLNGEHGAFIH